MDTVALTLRGEGISLEQFARGVEQFSLLMQELSKEAEAPDVKWEITDLSYGSAATFARGVSANGDRQKEIDQMVRAYAQIGEGLREGATIQFSEAVRRAASRLTEVIGNGVTAIHFETPQADVMVTEAQEVPARQRPELIAALGAVTGRIQTLTSRSKLRFTIYDRLYGRAVSCYLDEGQEELARDAWDKYARVEGLVWRDRDEGWPTSVREITGIHKIGDEGVAHGYRRARGAWRHDPKGPTPEERTRRLRDAS